MNPRNTPRNAPHNGSRHKVLVIGVGSIGERHLRCFAATGRAELALCELNPRLRHDVAGRYGVTAAYASLDEALADPPQVAVVCTPAQVHVPIATRLAEAGVHLLIEKPLSTDLAGLDALKRAVADRGLVAGVAYVHRAHPLLADMKQALDERRFGEPVALVAVTGQHFPTYRPAYREIYYNRRDTGGGAIQDALTHIFNAGEWLVGPIDRLRADAAHQVLAGVEVEDTVHALARHSRVMAAYTLNQHQAPNELTITVVCEQGTCRYEPHRLRWRWMREPGTDWQDQTLPALERDALFTRQAEAFLDAVEGKRPPLCTIEEGEQTLRVNLAALRTADAADGLPLIA